MPRIDLHIHTTASDGTDSPSRIAEQAADLGLSAIAITDHDTMNGVAEARQAGEALGISVLAGVELSTQYQDTEIHLLGYFFDPPGEGLRQVEGWNRTSRQERNRQMVAALAADGCPISMEQLQAAYPGAVLGRPHIAQALVEQGWADSVSHAFQRYLLPGCPYYLPRKKLPFAQGVQTILQNGGVAVLAHPLQYGFSPEQREAWMAEAAGLGVQGMEVYYSGYTSEETEMLLRLGEGYGLVPTGGSDYHGSRKPQIALGVGTGSLYVPETCLMGLRRCWEERQGKA